MAKVATKTATKSKARTRTTEKRPDDFKEAKRLIENIKESWFDFSIVVANIYDNGPDTWEKKGYADFATCAKEEWGLEYRSAMNRVTAGQAIKKFSITKKMAKDAGWTNFMEIASVFTPDMNKREIEGMIKKVSGMKHDEVVRFKQETKMKRVGGEVQKKVKMTFTFLNEQAEVIQNILNSAKELMGLDHDDLALEYCLVEWDTNHKTSAKSVESIKSQLKGDTGEEEEEEAPKAERKKRADAGKSKTKKKAEPEEEEEEEEEELLEDEEDFEEEEEDEEEVDEEEDFDFEDEE